MASPILYAADIHKIFPYPARTAILNGVDLTVARGETVAIMGRSGEGKSTLLNILGTLDLPCSGTLEIAGKNTAHTPKTEIRNTHIGFVFQSFHLLEDYTVLENVLIPARIARKNVRRGSPSYRHALELLDHVGLSARASFYAKQLSGGEKQRAAIARALCNNPDLILADEPSGNLDSENAQKVHELLLGFAKRQQKALIVVTHDEDLANLCDTQYRLRGGRLVTIAK